MNYNEMNILLFLVNNKYINQRDLMEKSGYSLGFVNKTLNRLLEDDFLDSDFNISNKTVRILEERKPKRAIILAAGYGMRMVPINLETPKGLLEVRGEILIERIIKQLHQVDIKEIYIVVGFLKEKFEYLIDEYGVNLVVNEDYDKKNNLHSLNLLSDKIKNSYIIPSDIWTEKNLFNKNELYSWYMVSNEICDESDVRVNRNLNLLKTNNSDGNAMIGISYLTGDEATIVEKRLNSYDINKLYDYSFWEETLYDKDRMIIPARVIEDNQAIELNTYEQLRELDTNSNNLKSEAIDIIMKVLDVKSNDIKNISVLKKGMTNRSFLFSCNDIKYIMRVPGEGTENLINRKEEAEIYNMINGKGVCDDVIYINPENGYKITKYCENSRVCKPYSTEDQKACMKKLKEFHNLRLKVNHEFDIFGKIDFYEKLWNGNKSVYKDYKETKSKIISLKPFIESNIDYKCLSHIDPVPDNFLITKDMEVRLIDWEYASMQDPHIDIAMFCLYSQYDKAQIDKIIDYYFDGKCDERIRLKIYCYISACGLLWSNWCEYKRNIGVDFGEYSIMQYRYAKNYYRIFMEEYNEGR